MTFDDNLPPYELYLVGAENIANRVVENVYTEDQDYFGYQFYLYDLRGSVTSIIKSNGELLKGYEFDEFGNTAEKGEEGVHNSIAYTGAVYDDTTGLYYMNARHYDPSTGRFMQQDTYKGIPNAQWTQHLYSYVGNNPVSMVDPTGHAACPYAQCMFHVGGNCYSSPDAAAAATTSTSGNNGAGTGFTSALKAAQAGSKRAIINFIHDFVCQDIAIKTGATWTRADNRVPGGSKTPGSTRDGYADLVRGNEVFEVKSSTVGESGRAEILHYATFLGKDVGDVRGLIPNDGTIPGKHGYTITHHPFKMVGIDTIQVYDSGIPGVIVYNYSPRAIVPVKQRDKQEQTSPSTVPAYDFSYGYGYHSGVPDGGFYSPGQPATGDAAKGLLICGTLLLGAIVFGPAILTVAPAVLAPAK